jgi:alpha-L-fucosidase
LYFSHPDWYDADFRPYGYDPTFYPQAIQSKDFGGNAAQLANTKLLMPVLYANAPVPTQAERDRMMARHRQQLTELLSNYGKIDMVCLDIQLGESVWPQLRETMLQLRKLQPDVMFRNRGIGQYGDYETPERVIPGNKKEGSLPWFVIYPLAKNFDYDNNADDYKGGDWIIRSLVDSVAKGGNFMLGVGPDANGRFNRKAIENIETAGAWLKINGEGIYATRAREGDLWHEGDEIRYTQSKDHQTIYAFSLHFPGKAVVLKTVEPMAGSPVYLFGYTKPLTWNYSPTDGTVIQMPEELQDPAKQKDFFVCGFKIQPQQ